MTVRTLIRQSLISAVVLTTAVSAAFAEQPVRHGYRDSIVSSPCASAPLESGAGYRDSLVRFASSSRGAATVRAAGYRDMLVRAPAPAKRSQLASAGGSFCAN